MYVLKRSASSRIVTLLSSRPPSVAGKRHNRRRKKYYIIVIRQQEFFFLTCESGNCGTGNNCSNRTAGAYFVFCFPNNKPLCSFSAAPLSPLGVCVCDVCTTCCCTLHCAAAAVPFGTHTHIHLRTMDAGGNKT